MKGGHNRKSGKVRELYGTARPDRAKSRAALKSELPRCPSWLCAEAKKFWRVVGPQLVDLGLLTPLDHAAFTALCQAWGRMREMEALLAEEGFVIEGPGGKKKHPAVTVLNQYSGHFRALCQEFGLTPNSRERLNIGTVPPTGGGMEDLLSGS